MEIGNVPQKTFVVIKGSNEKNTIALNVNDISEIEQQSDGLVFKDKNSNCIGCLPTNNVTLADAANKLGNVIDLTA